MNPTLKKICQFAKTGERELQFASLRVLAHLQPKDREVVSLLGDILQKTTDPGLRDLILDIPAKTGDPRYLNYLTPCLGNASFNRSRVANAFASIGGNAISHLEKRYPKASDYEKETILMVLGKVSSKKSVELLVLALQDSQQIERLKLISGLLKSSLDQFKKPEKTWFKKILLRQIAKPNVKKQNSLLISHLIQLGNLKDTTLKNFFIKTLNESHDTYVKKYALIGLMQLGLSGKGHDDVFKGLLPSLNHSDFPNIVKNVISILEKIEISKPAQKEITKLLENQHPSVRGFALSKLGTVDSTENVATLTGYLESPDHRIREAARNSLERMPKAAKTLLARFESSTRIDQMNQISSILKQHKKFFTPVITKRLFLKMEKMAQQNNQIYREYLNLIRNANPDFLYKEVFRKVALFKKKKKWEAVCQYIGLLEGSFLFNQEARYELAIARLKASKQDLSAAYREQNPGLSMLQGLIKSDPQGTHKKLLKERALDAGNRYFIGFHFSEKSYELREFGLKMLKGISKTKNKVGRQAKQKLAALAAV